MSKQLLVLKDFVSGSLPFGVFFPKKKIPKPDKVQTDEEMIEDNEPLLIELDFADNLLVPASSVETTSFYRALKKNRAVPDNCYWFYVQDEIGDDSISLKPEHMSIYHFGLNLGQGMFFSGRKDFDWSKNGGTVYKILPH